MIWMFIAIFGSEAWAGFKNAADFSENRQISAGSARTEFKIADFLNSNSKNSKKRNLEKLCKKVDKILRTLVEKNFQISTVLLDKIQIESKM
jgi:hypothetical protein